MLSANLEQNKIAAAVTFIVDGKYEKTITLKWNAQQKWTKLLFTGLEDREHTSSILVQCRKKSYFDTHKSAVRLNVNYSLAALFYNFLALLYSWVYTV